jgi:hypothetical protein
MTAPLAIAHIALTMRMKVSVLVAYRYSMVYDTSMGGIDSWRSRISLSLLDRWFRALLFKTSTRGEFGCSFWPRSFGMIDDGDEASRGLSWTPGRVAVFAVFSIIVQDSVDCNYYYDKVVEPFHGSDAVRSAGNFKVRN